MGSTGVKVYTTGQIAKMLCVAPRTVSKWIDNGDLKGFKIPKTDHRRVKHEDLKEFCQKHNLVGFIDDET